MTEQHVWLVWYCKDYDREELVSVMASYEQALKLVAELTRPVPGQPDWYRDEPHNEDLWIQPHSGKRVAIERRVVGERTLEWEKRP